MPWVSQNSSSAEAPYKAAAVRAVYFNLARARARDRDLNLDLNFALALALDLNLNFALARDLALTLVPDLAFARAFARARDLACARTRARDFDLGLGLALALDLACARAQDHDLKCQLQEVFDLLPDTPWKNRENFKKWWQANGEEWTEDVYQIMGKYRNIGHDWQFTDDQKALLQQYYDANLFLVECLNSDCYVSRSVREEIEATLLLPVGEIEN
jgi:predicted NACHT family NTPase